jgi:uncharacterized protein YndB with AHSA1/START domain
MTRVRCPAQLVFEAHSKCEHLDKWWSPRKYTRHLRDGLPPGWRLSPLHHGPDGVKHPEFRANIARSTPERIVWTFDGKACRAVSVGTLLKTSTEDEAYRTLFRFRRGPRRDAIRDEVGMVDVGPPRRSCSRDVLDPVGRHDIKLRFNITALDGLSLGRTRASGGLGEGQITSTTGRSS